MTVAKQQRFHISYRLSIKVIKSRNAITNIFTTASYVTIYVVNFSFPISAHEIILIRNFYAGLPHLLKNELKALSVFLCNFITFDPTDLIIELVVLHF